MNLEAMTAENDLSKKNETREKPAFHRSEGIRWKWMAASAAALGASTAEAETVQITFLNSKLTLTTNTLSADLTGDRKRDLGNRINVNQSTDRFTDQNGSVFESTLRYKVQVRVDFGGTSGGGSSSSYVFGNAEGSKRFTSHTAGTVENTSFMFRAGYYSSFYPGRPYVSGTTPQDLTFLYPVTFRDRIINQGKSTRGFLEVRSFNTAVNDHTVQFVRLIFDDASPKRPVVNVVDPAFPESPVHARNVKILKKKKRILRKMGRLKRKLKRTNKSTSLARYRALQRQIKSHRGRINALYRDPM